MPTTWQKEIIDTITVYWTIGWFWWAIMYLNQVRKWKPFRIGMFLINVLVASWIWILVKDLIPSNLWDIKYSVVSVAGFLSFPILDYLEENWVSLIIKRILWEKK